MLSSYFGGDQLAQIVSQLDSFVIEREKET